MSRLHRGSNRKVLALAAAAVVGFAGTANAVDTFWSAGTGAFEVNTNWSTGNVPTASDDAYINNAGTAQITSTSGAQSVNKMRLGSGSGNSGTLAISGGSLTTGTHMWVGGDDDPANPGLFILGTGTLNISGDGALNTGFGFHLALGYTGTANLNMTGGTLNAGLSIWPSMKPNSTYTGTHSAGAINVPNGHFWMGDGVGSTSTHTMSGGSMTLGGSMGVGAHSPATFNLSGTGSITMPGNLQVGDSIDGTGTLNISGGSIVTNWVLNGHVGDGTINMSGGTLETNILTCGQHSSTSVVGSTPTGIFNHTGGTVTVKSNVILAELSTEANLYDLNGGTLNLANTSGSNITFRVGAQGKATFKIRHADSVANIGRNLIVGGSQGGSGAAANSTGWLEVSAGTLNVGTGTAGDGILALGNVAPAFVTISGGTINADAVWTGYGQGSNTVVTQGKGEVTQTGGSVTSTTDFDIGRATNNANNFWVITGGSISVTDELTVARFSTDPAIATSPSPTLFSNGRFTVDGGTVTVSGQMSNSLGFVQTTGSNTGKIIPGGTGLIEVKSGSLTAASFVNGRAGDPSLPSSASASYVQTGGTASIGHVTGFGTMALSGGTLNVGSIRQSSLTITGGTAQVAASGGAATGTSNVSTLSMSGTGKLDLTDNKLIVVGAAAASSWNGTSYGGVAGLVQSGYNGGDWAGNGIVTSMSDAISPSVLTALVTMSADEAGYAGGNFGGQSVASGDQLIMYSWGGDANMDGTLNGDDYFEIDSNIAAAGTVFGYGNGDFNYDGDINGDDYFIIDSNIAVGQSSPPFPVGSGVGGLAAVPEPGSFGLIAAAGAALFGRRRRIGR